MKHARVAAILLLAFLFGGSSAEVAIQVKHAMTSPSPVADAPVGELVALEIHRDDGELVARPRVIAAPGRAAFLELRDPENPGKLRLTLRVETSRRPSGDIAVKYELSIPAENVFTRGKVSLLSGQELRLDMGDKQLVATLQAIPVPSSDFDAFLDAERAARTRMKRS